MRKHVFRVSAQVRCKPGCTATEDVERLEITDLESRGIVTEKYSVLSGTLYYNYD